MARDWEQAPDWHIYRAHPDTLAPWWMLDDRNGVEGVVTKRKKLSECDGNDVYKYRRT
jgi:hypothetical protein